MEFLLRSKSQTKLNRTAKTPHKIHPNADNLRERENQMRESRNVTTNLAKLCDSCKSATASLFCRNDVAFLCIPCDSNIHVANKVASRHARVLMCEVCEQAPAHVTCKADAAAHCISCDRDIHSANPLACRHERFPVVPFYDGDVRGRGVSYVDEEWLMPNLNAKMEDVDVDVNLGKVDFDSYLDLDFGGKEENVNEQESEGADGVVPEHCKGIDARMIFGSGGVVEDCFDVDFVEPVKGFPYFGSAANVNSINHSVSSSSHEVGVVPDDGMMIDMSNPFGRQNSSVGEAVAQAVPLFGTEREAKVLRYKEKRKNRKFEKTIRYASRKAYAEIRPRIKGRFAKRTKNDVAVVDQMYDMNLPAIGNGAAGFGVLPSYLLNESY